MSQEICYEAMRINPASFFIVPVHFKTKGWSIKAVEVDPWQLESVSDHFKTLEMCDKAVREDSFSLQCVPDWFVTQEQVKSWHDDMVIVMMPNLLQLCSAHGTTLLGICP